METLIVIAQHRNQFYGRIKPARFNSSPSRNFREINCRTFQSGTGILPTPLQACVTPSHAPKRTLSSPKSLTNDKSHSEDNKNYKKRPLTSSIPINIKASNDESPFSDDLSYSERWAGPTYSNSPPPSSLPIPKFSLKTKRTVSLDLPSNTGFIRMHPIAKSAPPSPRREQHNQSSSEFFDFADSATQNLRRILNLDIADE